MQTISTTAPSTSYRDAAILEHMALVKRVVRRVSRRVPDTMDREALFGAGVVGLIQAVDHYDESKGVSFETYARIRIKGAVQDELRGMDHLTRDQRKLASTVAEAKEKLTRELGREAEDYEVAAATGLGLDEVRAGALSQSGPQSVDPSIMDETVTGTLWQEQPTAERTLFEKEDRRLVMEALGELSEREQTVMSLYYAEGLNLAEIGAILQVSQSRVSQIISKVKRDLRARLLAAR